MNELRRCGYNLDKVALVCNRAGRESGYLEPGDVETTLGRKLNWSVPDEWKTASMAVNVGAPLLEAAPKSRLRAAFQQMANDIANRKATYAAESGKSNGEPAKKSLLSSLFAG